MNEPKKPKDPAPWYDEEQGVLRPRAVERYARILRLMRKFERDAIEAGINVRPKIKDTPAP